MKSEATNVASTAIPTSERQTVKVRPIDSDEALANYEFPDEKAARSSGVRVGSRSEFEAERARQYSDPKTIDQRIQRHLARLKIGWYDNQPNGDRLAQQAEDAIRGAGWSGKLDAEVAKQTAENAPQFQYLDPSGFTLDTPEALLMGDSAASQINADPQLVAAQNRALEQLSQWSQGDVTDADRAMYDAQSMAARQDADQMARGQREAVLQGMSARGLGGSNAELAAMMGANQAATQRYASQDSQDRANMLGNVQNRALNALSNYGNQAGQMRDQGFSEAYKRGQATDQNNQDNMNFRRQVWGENQNRAWNAYVNNTQSMNNNLLGISDRQAQASGDLAGYYQGNANYNAQQAQQANQRQNNRTEAAVRTGSAVTSLFDDDDAGKRRSY